MEHDLGRVGERDLADQREERVPERERVAGVEPAVGELVHRREREAAELDELAHAREVEEAVAADLAGDVPEEEPEHGARAPTPRRGPGSAARPAAGARTAPRTTRGHEQQDERQRQRGVDEEHDAHRAEDDPEAPRERRRGAPHADRPGDDRAGREHEPRRRGEPDEQEERAHRSISERTSPVPSQRAPSRYIAPCCPRTTCPRRVRDAAAACATRSASRLAVVLEEEAKMAAEVLAVEAAAVRGAADVDALARRA